MGQSLAIECRIATDGRPWYACNKEYSSLSQIAYVLALQNGILIGWLVLIVIAWFVNGYLLLDLGKKRTLHGLVKPSTVV